MAGLIQTTPFGVQDVFAMRGVGKISPNVRAKATTGFMGTVADVIAFPGPSVIGQWVVPNQRCLATGIPTIAVSSVGITYSSLGTPIGPMVVVQPDPRVTAL